MEFKTQTKVKSPVNFMMACNSAKKLYSGFDDSRVMRKQINESINTEESAEVMPTCEDLRETEKSKRLNFHSLKVKCYLTELKTKGMAALNE